MASPLLKRLLRREVHSFLDSISRARTLFDSLALNGASMNSGIAQPLRQPDRRDVTQFLFLEVAAAWENFSKQCFLIAARHYYHASAQKAEYIVGNPDRGLENLMGWGSPRQLVDRATHLLGSNSEIARLRRIPSGNQLYQRLEWAHKIRNRIAHVGPNDKYRGLLSQAGIPAAQRKGVGPGRLLLDYPAPATNGDRWFDRLLNTYRDVAERWRDHLL